MLELQSGLNFHNFYLDCQPRTFFKRIKGETVGDWLTRTAYQGDAGFLGRIGWRKINKYWLDSSFEISFAVLSFLRENKIEKEELEETVGFELNLKGEHDWTLSEIKKLELILKVELL
jgi:hypothetical protein